MQANLYPALEWILANEGGFSARKEEPGGAVNKGVSFLVFKEWRKKHGKDEPSIVDLKILTVEEASALYADKYAKPIHFDELPNGLDFNLLDIAVMEGPRGALLLLQQALELRTVSGMWDAHTMGGLLHPDVQALVAKLNLLHMNKKMHSPSIDKFGKGWGDRIIRRYNRAREMMK